MISRASSLRLLVPGALALLPVGAAAFLLFSAPAFAAPEAGGYKLVSTQPLPGDTKWDYLAFDAGSHRLFITHGDHVDVLDTVTGKSAGSIAGTDGVHGVALAPGLDRGFTSNGKAGTVTIFELSTLKTVATVTAEKKPDAIVYDPASDRVFVANGDSGTLTVLEAKTGKVLSAIKLEGKPEFAAVDGRGRLFVNIEDKNQIDAVDTQKLAVTARFDISASCDEPAGLAIDPDKTRLFATCHNQKMVVVDGTSGKILAALPIGKGTDAAIYDAGTGLAFSSNGDGTLTVVSGDPKTGYAVRETVKTLPGARTMALDAAARRIYLVTGEVDHVDQATTEHPNPRPHYKDNSFTLLTVANDTPSANKPAP